MTAHEDPRGELLERCASIRHLHGEHVRAHVGTAARRHQEIRLREAIDHLERRLRELVDDEDDRQAWRAHAQDGPAPDRPEALAAAAPPPAPDRPSGRRPWPR